MRPPLNSRWPSEQMRVKKTSVGSTDTEAQPVLSHANWCIFHRKPEPLKKCRVFQAKTFDEKTKILKQNRICFRCIASCDHLAKDCKAKITLTECKSNRQLATLHVQREENYGKENEHNESATKVITSNCAEVCGSASRGKSCSKICLANVYERGHPETKVIKNVRSN